MGATFMKFGRAPTTWRIFMAALQVGTPACPGNASNPEPAPV
jgi:hypothetical protein